MNAMNAKISVVVICIQVIIYLLLQNLRDCTFKQGKIKTDLHVKPMDRHQYSVGI